MFIDRKKILAALACSAALAAVAPASAADFVHYSWTTTSQGFGLNLGQPTTASFDVLLSVVQTGKISVFDITNIQLAYPGITLNNFYASSGGLDNAAYVNPLTGAAIYHGIDQGLSVGGSNGPVGSDTFLSITFDNVKYVNGVPQAAVADQYNALKNGSPWAGYPTAGYWTATFPTQGGVPEPASWAMMLGGLGLVGGAMRRRRASVSFA